VGTEPTPARDRLGPALSGLAFLAAAIPRLIYFVAARPDFSGDYWMLATGLRQFRTFGFDGYQTTQFEPAYPGFLAALRALTFDAPVPVQLAQIAVAALGAVCLARLTLALTGNRRTSLVAAMLFAVYPLLVRHAADGSDAALSTTLLIGFADAFVRARAPAGFARAGAWLGASVLTRSVALPVLVLGAGLLLVRRRPAAAAAFAATTVLVLLPWGLRNIALNGWPLPTRSGLNLFISNSEYTPRLIPAYGPDILVPYANAVIEPAPDIMTVPEGERYRDRAWSRAAVQAVRRQPGAIAWLKVRNLWYFFSPRLVPTHEPTADMQITFGEAGSSTVVGSPPRSRLNEAVYAVTYGPTLVLALTGVYLRRSRLRGEAILWIVLWTFALTHAVYFPTTRYRVAVEFVLLFYAAVALNGWWTARFGAERA
jgi:hypothetical protein